MGRGYLRRQRSADGSAERLRPRWNDGRPQLAAFGAATQPKYSWKSPRCFRGRALPQHGARCRHRALRQHGAPGRHVPWRQAPCR